MRAVVTGLLQSVALLICITAGTARAEEWQWSVTPYAWASDISANIQGVNGASVGGDLGFSDLLDKVDLAAMGHLEGRRGSVGFFVDVIYLGTSDKYEVEGHRVIPTATEVKTELDTLMVEVGGFVHPFGEDSPLELLAGIRTISIDLELTLTPPAATSESFKADDTMIDVFGGARLLVPLSERVFVTLRGDVATGDTDFTYNLIGLVGYEFGQEKQYGLLAGYRYMKISLKDSDGPAEAETDLTFKGPIAGFMYKF